MITVLYVLFGRDQNNTNLEKEETKKLDTRLETIKQRLKKKSLNQNSKLSDESNLELTITSNSVFPEGKFPLGLEKSG